MCPLQQSCLRHVVRGMLGIIMSLRPFDYTSLWSGLLAHCLYRLQVEFERIMADQVPFVKSLVSTKSMSIQYAAKQHLI